MEELTNAMQVLEEARGKMEAWHALKIPEADIIHEQRAAYDEVMRVAEGALSACASAMKGAKSACATGT